MSTSKRVCIKVPGGSSSGASAQRRVYDSLEDGPGKRDKWVLHVLGEHGKYVGRPKNDGGWHQSHQVKRGSFVANPYPLKHYTVQDSLRLYEQYLRRRMEPDCTLNDVIDVLPEKDRAAARKCYDGRGGGGRSMLHLELDCRGKEFKTKLMALRGVRLACFCDLGSACHVDVLLRVLAED